MPYKKGMTVTADSTIADVLKEKPQAPDILFRFGMGCIGCALANGETLRQAAIGHGIPLDELLEALGMEE
jgi:hybrid cluster-associated redox disulfide protein